MHVFRLHSHTNTNDVFRLVDGLTALRIIKPYHKPAEAASTSARAGTHSGRLDAANASSPPCTWSTAAPSVGCSAALSAAKLVTDGWDTYVLNTNREG